jgi:hypothetical protein
MEIKEVTYREVKETFEDIKHDLLDSAATYFGCYINEECHAFVKDEFRERGVYKLLWNYS